MTVLNVNILADDTEDAGPAAEPADSHQACLPLLQYLHELHSETARAVIYTRQAAHLWLTQGSLSCSCLWRRAATARRVLLRWHRKQAQAITLQAAATGGYSLSPGAQGVAQHCTAGHGTPLSAEYKGPAHHHQHLQGDQSCCTASAMVGFSAPLLNRGAVGGPSSSYQGGIPQSSSAHPMCTPLSRWQRAGETQVYFLTRRLQHDEPSAVPIMRHAEQPSPPVAL